MQYVLVILWEWSLILLNQLNITWSAKKTLLLFRKLSNVCENEVSREETLAGASVQCDCLPTQADISSCWPWEGLTIIFCLHKGYWKSASQIQTEIQDDSGCVVSTRASSKQSISVTCTSVLLTQYIIDVKDVKAFKNFVSSSPCFERKKDTRVALSVGGFVINSFVSF